MSHYHSIVWIDHHKAVVWRFTDDQQSKTIVKARDQHEHTHLRKTPHGGHRAQGDLDFFEDVAKTLSGSRELLIVGPAQAKEEFIAFIRTKHPQEGVSVVGIESADHPTDAQLLAYARQHFKVIDRMI